MKRVTQFLAVGFLCAAGFGLCASSAHAQFNRFNNRFGVAGAPNRFNTPGLNQGWAYLHQASQLQNYNNRQQLSNAAYGAYTNAFNSGMLPTPYYANPYYGGVPAVTPFTPFVGPVVNPYMPYNAGYGMTTNPYSAGIGGSNAYSPYGGGSNPYSAGGYGGGGYGYGPGSVLTGEANVLQAYGSYITKQEEARILRETALQAKLDTKKKKFELNMYIAANTPTYTQEQEKIQRTILRRIQTNSLPGEVVNGKSLNLLLSDLLKFKSKQSSLDPLALNETVLSHLDVTKTTYGLGVLRDQGRVTWPGAVQDRFKDADQRERMEKQLRNLVKEANNDRVDRNVLQDVRNEVERLREELVKKVNEIPTPQYMDAKRFLRELDNATRAIEQGEAPNNTKFQRFVEGGRSIQEVVEYMGKNALHFGPATASDESAYRAVHQAMAAYDIAMNSQFGVQGGKE